MTENYIKPEDVSPQVAQKVLDFLNSTQSAAEIAQAVEIPNERDVGIIVAQHILDRREQLGGFNNIQQIADVQQVGPERFTEIVTILGKEVTTVASKSFVVETYKVAVGRFPINRVASIDCRSARSAYGSYDLLSVHFNIPGSPMPNNSASPDATRGGLHVTAEQFSWYMDLLRNEKPVHAYINSDKSVWNQLYTGEEPVGEGET